MKRERIEAEKSYYKKFPFPLEWIGFGFIYLIWSNGQAFFPFALSKCTQNKSRCRWDEKKINRLNGKERNKILTEEYFGIPNHTPFVSIENSSGMEERREKEKHLEIIFACLSYVTQWPVSSWVKILRYILRHRLAVGNFVISSWDFKPMSHCLQHTKISFAEIPSVIWKGTLLL